MTEIHLYTAATMNGYKPVIFLEEAGIPYDLTFVDFAKQEQKAPDYLKLNPNGKIPTIVDRSEDRPIFESGAILWHLAEKYSQFLPDDPLGRSEVMQWLFFQVGHIGPMMGQAMYFQRIAAPNGQEEPFSIKRYVDESRRLLEVLDARLEGREWIAADQYTIADMAIYPWARAFVWAKVSVDGLPHLQSWFEQIDARPAVQRALTIPKAQPAFWGEADETAFLNENAARFASDVKSVR
ncbi:glutathione binding-like protein [uncultured Thalassospira sp.]|uniref:glutathione S-transferase family protein n=1 Tax=uncultured Thalassospira sp. TaxID=404382 RepID=UPI0025870DE6|nr:glutathione binding-like protein [uncultured Thalassospira sp.]